MYVGEGVKKAKKFSDDFFFKLTPFIFSVPEIEIVDERDKSVKEKYYKGGSTIELKCVVRQVVDRAPEYIIWHHEDRMLNYDTERGGIRYNSFRTKQ